MPFKTVSLLGYGQTAQGLYHHGRGQGSSPQRRQSSNPWRRERNSGGNAHSPACHSDQIVCYISRFDVTGCQHDATSLLHRSPAGGADGEAYAADAEWDGPDEELFDVAPSAYGLTLLTMERRSNLHFHLLHAWIGAHMRLALHQARFLLAWLFTVDCLTVLHSYLGCRLVSKFNVSRITARII